MIHHLAAPAALGLLFVAPFILLELKNRGVNQGFPVPLFVMLFGLPFAFFLILIPVVRRARNRQAPAALVLRAGVLLLIAAAWVGLVRDQMPCFLGVPNCD